MELKEPVRLRRKKLKNGNISLYLDIYWEGKRDYEFLKLYLTNSTLPEVKARNKEILQTAQAIKAQRNVEVISGKYDFLRAFKLDTKFIDYFIAEKEKRKKSNKKKLDEEEKDNCCRNWNSTLKHLSKYCKPSTTFKDIDKKFVTGFKDFLAKEVKSNGEPLADGTQSLYFSKFIACLKQAHRDRIIQEVFWEDIELPERGENGVVYLTLEEIRALVQTECRNPILKRAFIFSCLTGLRWSDVYRLTWRKIEAYNGSTRLIFKQKKTKGQVYLDINLQAMNFIGERGNAGLDEKVFKGLKYSGWQNILLSQWCANAGISKHITFHVARHTFAVIMLDSGADIYTVMKLMGHKSIRTTLIYADIMDKKKQQTVALLPDIINFQEVPIESND